jgi:hypothetical protein
VTKLLAVVVTVAISAACGEACRVITTKQLALTCSSTSDFEGEIHFDDSATFESFLLTDCLPDDTDAQRQEIVNSIDFTKNAVFVAVGARQDPGGSRCIADRQDDDVQVCDDGLRVDFNDKVTDDTQCQGKWTVAFSLPRAELRAALGTQVSSTAQGQ